MSLSIRRVILFNSGNGKKIHCFSLSSRNRHVPFLFRKGIECAVLSKKNGKCVCCLSRKQGTRFHLTGDDGLSKF